MAERIRKAIGPKTRAVGVTWVHSSSGLRLPIARIAETLAQVNRSRDEKDRVLLIVDGVHGIGVEDPKITALGCDAFAAGTHKWLFGPRGTATVLSKATTIAASLFMVTSLILVILANNRAPSSGSVLERTHHAASVAKKAPQQKNTPQK